MTNSADPDQLASSEANWSGSTLFAKARHIRVQQDQGNYLHFTQRLPAFLLVGNWMIEWSKQQYKKCVELVPISSVTDLYVSTVL